jgi:hypothetical protein
MIRIFGDSISGNCLKVKWVAERLGHAHAWIEVDILKGETRTDDFLALNPFGQVPVVQFEDGRTLSQSFRPLRLQNGLYIQRTPDAARRHSLRQLNAAQMRKLADDRRALRPRATATSRRARTCSSTGRSWRTCRTSWPNWPTSRCTPSRPRATASATSPPTSSPASRRRDLTDPRPWCEICASGRPSTRNSPSCRASSRSPSRRPSTTAPRSACTTSACTSGARRGRTGLRGLVGGGLGRTPMVGKVVREFLPRQAPAQLSRSHPARLQPLRPPRQQVQGAHQDPRGEEFYQILLGGRADEKAALGEIVGPGLKAEEVPGAIHRVVEYYRTQRTSPAEKFIDTLERLGHAPFQEALYAAG